MGKKFAFYYLLGILSFFSILDYVICILTNIIQSLGPVPNALSHSNDYISITFAFAATSIRPRCHFFDIFIGTSHCLENNGGRDGFLDVGQSKGNCSVILVDAATYQDGVPRSSTHGSHLRFKQIFAPSFLRENQNFVIDSPHLSDHRSLFSLDYEISTSVVMAFPRRYQLRWSQVFQMTSIGVEHYRKLANHHSRVTRLFSSIHTTTIWRFDSLLHINEHRGTVG